MKGSTMPRHHKSFAALVLMAELCSVIPLHAAPAYITNPIPVRVTHVSEWFRPTTSRLCFSALSVDPYYVPPTPDQLASGAAPLRSQLLPVASWTLPNGASGLPANVALVTDGKKLVPGNYIIECWLDLDGDGSFAPGEPYGCEKLYDLTPTNKIGRIAIELMEVSPSLARMDLATLIAAMPATTNESPAFAPLAAATDRGRWSVPYASVAPATTCGTNKPPSTSPVTRVRVVRDLINALPRPGDTSSAAVLLDRYFDLATRKTLTEADWMADGKLDIDWGSLNLAFNGNSSPSASLTNATYRIVIGEGDVGKYENEGNNLPSLFSNRYEAKLYQAPTISHFFETNGQPAFCWAHTNSIDKPYPAFRIRIYTSEGMSETSRVFDSGPKRAPARSASGMYAYASPVYPGLTTTNLYYFGTSEEGTNVHTFSASQQYWWAVSMLDSKFTRLSSQETAHPFVLPPATNSSAISH